MWAEKVVAPVPGSRSVPLLTRPRGSAFCLVKTNLIAMNPVKMATVIMATSTSKLTLFHSIHLARLVWFAHASLKMRLASLAHPKPPISLKKLPTNTSANVTITVINFVDPTRMNVVARAKIVPARKVSIVSWKGKIQESPFSLTNGTIASLKNDSTTQSSRRILRSPPAIRGPYSTKLSEPTTASVEPWRKR